MWAAALTDASENYQRIGSYNLSDFADAKTTVKNEYTPTSDEQKLIDVANDMTVSDFTTPEGAYQYSDRDTEYLSLAKDTTKNEARLRELERLQSENKMLQRET